MAGSSSTVGQRVQQGLGAAGESAAAWPSLACRLPAGLGTMLEEERRRWLLWLPVALGSGIALLFALPREPPLWAGWLAAGAGLACALLAARSWRGAPSVGEALLLGCRVRLPGLRLGPSAVEHRGGADPCTGRGLCGRGAGRGPGAPAERRARAARSGDAGRRGARGDAGDDPGQSAPRARRPDAGRRDPCAGPIAAADGAGATRGVRFRAAGLVRAPGCRGLLHGLGRAAAGRCRRLRPGPGGAARPHRPAHHGGKPRPRRGHGRGAGGGRARRHRPGDLARHAGLGPGPHPLGVGPAHGDGGRQCVRHLPLAAGPVSRPWRCATRSRSRPPQSPCWPPPSTCCCLAPACRRSARS